MKLRIRGNSLRLRLLRGEVAQFGEKKNVSEIINFGATKLTYSLKISESADKISADFTDQEIIVKVPQKIADVWVRTEQVGLESSQIISEKEELKILIEKDFVCLDRPDDADNADAYPHLEMK